MGFLTLHSPITKHGIRLVGIATLALVLAKPVSAQISPENDAQQSMLDATINMCPSLGARRDNPGIQQSDAEASLNEFCDALVTTQFSDTEQVLQRVAGEEVLGVQDQITEIRNIPLGHIMSRMTAIRSGQASGAGISVANLDISVGDEVLVGAARDDRLNEDDSAMLSTLDWQKLGVYLSGSVRFGNKDETRQAGGFSFDTSGITLGLDYRLTDNLLVGGAIGYTRYDVDFDVTSESLAGQDLGSDGITLAGYAAYFPKPQFFIDGALTLGWLNYETRRRIRAVGSSNVDDIDAITKGKFDSFYYGLAARAGYETRLIGRVQMTPTFQLEYVRAKIDGFEENSSDARADAISLAFGNQRAESLRSKLGVELRRGFQTPIGPTILAGRAIYNHELIGDDAGVNVRYKADPTRLSEFELRTEGRDRHYGELGASLRAAKLPFGLEAFVDYATIVGLRDFEIHNINAGVRKSFLP